MYYELYIDVFFLINFMMDSLLLLAIKKALKCPAGNARAFLGGVVGAVLTCVLVSIPLPPVVKFPVYYVGMNGIMLRVGLKIQKKNEFWKAFVLLYVFAFLMGGMMQVLRPWLRTGSLFFAAAVPAYYLLCGIWHFMVRARKKTGRICEVVLYIGMEKYRVNALMDTGNGLTDPVSGEPVSVIDPACARQMLKEEGENKGIRYIPYRTLGGDGVMPVFRTEQMEVFVTGEKEEFRIKSPVIGICEGQISERKEYQMILNPDVLV